MNATGGAKFMLDCVLVERIDAQSLFGSEKAQLLARHEPEK
jgi:hypothetical protein